MIAFDTSGQSTNWAGSTSFSLTVQPGSFLVAVMYHSIAFNSCQFNGYNFTLIDTQSISGSNVRLMYLDLKNTSPVTANLTASTTTAEANSAIAVISFTGVYGIGASDKASAVGSGLPYSLTLTYPNSWTVEGQGGYVSPNSGITFTQANSQTAREDIDTNFLVDGTLATKSHTVTGSASLGFTTNIAATLGAVFVELTDAVEFSGGDNLMVY